MLQSEPDLYLSQSERVKVRGEGMAVVQSVMKRVLIATSVLEYILISVLEATMHTREVVEEMTALHPWSELVLSTMQMQEPTNSPSTRVLLQRVNPLRLRESTMEEAQDWRLDPKREGACEKVGACSEMKEDDREPDQAQQQQLLQEQPMNVLQQAVLKSCAGGVLRLTLKEMVEIVPGYCAMRQYLLLMKELYARHKVYPEHIDCTNLGAQAERQRMGLLREAAQMLSWQLQLELVVMPLDQQAFSVTVMALLEAEKMETALLAVEQTVQCPITIDWMKWLVVCRWAVTAVDPLEVVRMPGKQQTRDHPAGTFMAMAMEGLSPEMTYLVQVACVQDVAAEMETDPPELLAQRQSTKAALSELEVQGKGLPLGKLLPAVNSTSRQLGSVTATARDCIQTLSSVSTEYCRLTQSMDTAEASVFALCEQNPLLPASTNVHQFLQYLQSFGLQQESPQSVHPQRLLSLQQQMLVAATTEAVTYREAALVLVGPEIELKLKVKSQQSPLNQVGHDCPPLLRRWYMTWKYLSPAEQVIPVQALLLEAYLLLAMETELQPLGVSRQVQKVNRMQQTLVQEVVSDLDTLTVIELVLTACSRTNPLAVTPLGSQTQLLPLSEGPLWLLQPGSAVWNTPCMSQLVVVVDWNSIHPPDAQDCGLAQAFTCTLVLLGLEEVDVAWKLRTRLVPEKAYTLYISIWKLALSVWQVTGLSGSLPMTPASTLQLLVPQKALNVRPVVKRTAMTMVEGSLGERFMLCAVLVLMEMQCQETVLIVRSITSTIAMENLEQVSVSRLVVVHVWSTEQEQRMQPGCRNKWRVNALLMWCIWRRQPKMQQLEAEAMQVEDSFLTRYSLRLLAAQSTMKQSQWSLLLTQVKSPYAPQVGSMRVHSTMAQALVFWFCCETQQQQLVLSNQRAREGRIVHEEVEEYEAWGYTLKASITVYLPMNRLPITWGAEQLPPNALNTKEGNTPTMSGLVMRSLRERLLPLCRENPLTQMRVGLPQLVVCPVSQQQNTGSPGPTEQGQLPPEAMLNSVGLLYILVPSFAITGISSTSPLTSLRLKEMANSTQLMLLTTCVPQAMVTAVMPRLGYAMVLAWKYVGNVYGSMQQLVPPVGCIWMGSVAVEQLREESEKPSSCPLVGLTIENSTAISCPLVKLCWKDMVMVPLAMEHCLMLKPLSQQQGTQQNRSFDCWLRVGCVQKGEKVSWRVWQDPPERSAKVVGTFIRKENTTFIAFVPMALLSGSNSLMTFSLWKVRQVCLVQAVEEKRVQVMVVDGRLEASCFMKQQSSELAMMVGLAQSGHVQQRMTKLLRLSVEEVIGFMIVLSMVWMMRLLLLVQVVFCTGWTQMVSVVGSIQQVLTSITEAPYSMQLLPRKLKSLVVQGGNWMEMSLTREVELPAVLPIEKVNLQSSLCPFCLLLLTGDTVKVPIVGQFGTVEGYVSLQLMTSDASAVRQATQALMAAVEEVSWVDGLQNSALICMLSVVEPLATRFRELVPILRRTVWQFSMKMTSPVEVSPVLQERVPLVFMDCRRGKLNFMMQRSEVTRVRVLRAVKERVTPVASLAVLERAKLPKSITGVQDVGSTRMPPSIMFQHGFVADPWRKVYTCTGIERERVLAGFTTQNPILMVEVVRTVDAKLEHTILTGWSLVGSPRYTLQDMEAMVLSNISKTRESQSMQPMPRSLGNIVTPSRPTVGISITNWELVASATEGVNWTMMKLGELGTEMVEVNMRVLKLLPQVSMKYALLALAETAVAYVIYTSTLYTPMTVGKLIPSILLPF